jgi:uncharacterized protein YacL
MERNDTNYLQMELEELAKKRVRKIKRFFNHLLIYSIGLVVFILKEYFDAPFNFPPVHFLNWFFMLCWTVVLAVQGLKLLIKEVVLGKNWENRQMSKILESESNNQNWK